jgi:hypothetical protein
MKQWVSLGRANKRASWRRKKDAMATVTVTEYFGGCPTCGKNNGYLNAGRSHRFYCVAHKTSWMVGANLFDSWRFETEEEQLAKWAEIGMSTFADVVPLSEGATIEVAAN